MYLSPSSTLMPLRLQCDFHPHQGYLWAPELLFVRGPPQSNCPPGGVSRDDQINGIRFKQFFRPVFHCWLPSPQKVRIKACRLRYAESRLNQRQAAVKLHGSFLSWHRELESSRGS